MYSVSRSPQQAIDKVRFRLEFDSFPSLFDYSYSYGDQQVDWGS